MKANEIVQKMTEHRQYNALCDETEYRWDFSAYGVADTYQPGMGDEAMWAKKARLRAAAKIEQMISDQLPTGDENTFRRVDWNGDEPQLSDDDGPDGMPLRPPGMGLSAEDLELLQLAARALGATRVEVVEGERWVNLYFADGSTAWNWNPLIHSDDMLNLSALLRIDIEWEGDSVVFADGNWSEPTDGNPAAAARRAVTFAAAEIGKQRSS